MMGMVPESIRMNISGRFARVPNVPPIGSEDRLPNLQEDRMSFSDNLENSLKNLEARDEFEASRTRSRKGAAAGSMPMENLKTHKFTAELLSQATRIGHGLKTKVNIFFFFFVLRIDARHHRLELRPTGNGVFAHFLVDGVERNSEKVSLDGSAGALAKRWLDAVGPAPPVQPVPPDFGDEIG